MDTAPFIGSGYWKIQRPQWKKIRNAVVRTGLTFLAVAIISFWANAQKPRLIVTTDIGQDPDDEQSMVRLLHYANEFQLEGLIANADANSSRERPVLQDHVIHDMIRAYESIETRLRAHDADYPTGSYLHSIVKKGCFGNAEHIPYDAFIGEGKDTQGSDWIIKAVDKADLRPLNISVWGGACDLAQALWKVKSTRSSLAVDTFVSKVRVYFIGKQDSSNDWIIQTFPNLWIILALDRGGDKWESGYRGMFWGGDMSLTSKEWLHRYIVGKNPLADLYPDQAFTGGEKKNPHMAMKEGDSPAFQYFLDNGLNSPDHPGWGGWGGRYVMDERQLARDASDTYYDEQMEGPIHSPRATVFRWRGDFQQDFATRVTWGVLPPEKANHHPRVVVNGNTGTTPLTLQVRAGKNIKLDAAQSMDPDGDKVSYHWMQYREAGTFEGTVGLNRADQGEVTVNIPAAARGKMVQIILSVRDQRDIPLTAYKRIVLNVH